MSVITQTPARELTAQEQQERAELCRTIETRIMSHVAVGRGALWELAKDFYEFNENNGHSALGYETQDEWLAQPEIGIARSVYFKLIRRYRVMSIERQVPMEKLVELEPSKLDIVMPTIEDNKAKLETVMEDVKTLGARDLSERYLGPRSAVKGGDDVIDSEAHDVEGNGAVDDKTAKEAAKLHDALAAVDSWIEVGGDRRKVQRAFKRALEMHPFFQAISRVESAVQGGDEALDREEIPGDWKVICKTLRLNFD